MAETPETTTALERGKRMRSDLEPLPARMLSLAIDDRGYPVPWFVAWVDGKPEFRAMDAAKLRSAVQNRRCWVCGEPLGRYMTFVIGPMCGINRTCAEPPSHLECAEWSARNCPFLSNAKVKRREDDAINNQKLQADSPGFAITRNPGVTLLWTTRKYQRFTDGRGGMLFHIGEPEHVEFYANGKRATRAEVFASVESGIPALQKMAESESPEAVWELQRMRKRFEAMIPDDVVTALERGERALDALADTPEEIECVVDAVLDDLNDRFDGRDYNDQTGWR